MLWRDLHCGATCPVELRGPLEEVWQCCLQDHDEVLQLLSDSDQQVLVHQVVFGLFQGPSTAYIPAHSSSHWTWNTICTSEISQVDVSTWCTCWGNSLICLSPSACNAACCNCAAELGEENRFCLKEMLAVFICRLNMTILIQLKTSCFYIHCVRSNRLGKGLSFSSRKVSLSV